MADNEVEFGFGAGVGETHDMDSKDSDAEVSITIECTEQVAQDFIGLMRAYLRKR